MTLPDIVCLTRPHPYELFLLEQLNDEAMSTGVTLYHRTALEIFLRLHPSEQAIYLMEAEVFQREGHELSINEAKYLMEYRPINIHDRYYQDLSLRIALCNCKYQIESEYPPGNQDHVESEVDTASHDVESTSAEHDPQEPEQAPNHASQSETEQDEQQQHQQHTHIEPSSNLYMILDLAYDDDHESSDSDSDDEQYSFN